MSTSHIFNLYALQANPGNVPQDYYRGKCRYDKFMYCIVLFQNPIYSFGRIWFDAGKMKSMPHIKWNLSNFVHCKQGITLIYMANVMRKGTFGHMQKSVDPDQPPRLRRRVWSGSALFDNHNINGTNLSWYVNNFIMYRCFQHRIGADLGLHYVKCPKVLFRVTLAKCFFLFTLFFAF